MVLSILNMVGAVKNTLAQQELDLSQLGVRWKCYQKSWLKHLRILANCIVKVDISTKILEFASKFATWKFTHTWSKLLMVMSCWIICWLRNNCITGMYIDYVDKILVTPSNLPVLHHSNILHHMVSVCIWIVILDPTVEFIVHQIGSEYHKLQVYT